MRDRWVIANWKMHGDPAMSRRWSAAMRQVASEAAGIGVALCPPYTCLPAAVEALSDGDVILGAQNCHEKSQGAFTGEVSATMLAELGCELVILGHSERRRLCGETDSLVVAKAGAALDAGLRPVLCLGETASQRTAGKTRAVVTAQLAALVKGVGTGLERAIIAYEPVWAIGTGATATPEQAGEVHGLLREQLGNLAADVPIIYGGSVNAGNATALFAQEDVDGALVGGASLDAVEFAAICHA